MKFDLQFDDFGLSEKFPPKNGHFLRFFDKKFPKTCFFGLHTPKPIDFLVENLLRIQKIIGLTLKYFHGRLGN